jgi:hypothetical protein
MKIESLSPAQMITADMVPDDVGTWMYHCHVSDHMEAGMMVCTGWCRKLRIISHCVRSRQLHLCKIEAVCPCAVLAGALPLSCSQRPSPLAGLPRPIAPGA